MGQFTPFTKVLTILKDHGDDVDLSSAFTTLEWIEGVPQTMKITLIGYLGKFLTIAPLIQHWDRIYLEYEGINGNTEQDVFHVQNISRTDLAGGGIKLVLTCPHQTSNIWKRSVSLTIRRRSNFTALEKVIEQLNLTKGSNDPMVLSPTFDIATKLGNDLSKNTFNDYTFEMKKLSNTFNEIGDKEAQPIEGGGKFQPPYIRFKSNYDHLTGLGLDEVNIQAYAQGFNKNIQSDSFTNIPNITLSHFPRTSPSEDVAKNNILETDSDEDPERATNIVLRGELSAGDYLGDWTKYQGALDFFNRARIWDGTTTFTPGAFVVGPDGNRYEATLISLNQPPPSTPWIQRLFIKPADFNIGTNYSKFTTVVSEKIVWKSNIDSNVGNLPGSNDSWTRVFYQPPTDYSPETKNRAQDWINSFAGSKYANLNTGQTRAIDANCIIKDSLHPRTYVRFVGKNPNLIPSSLKQGGGTIIPDAFKVLVVEPNYTNDPPTATDVGEGDFAGNDPNGIPFAGNVAQYVDPDKNGTGTWFVFLGNQTTQDQEIIDFDEDISWVKNPCQPPTSFFPAWVDGTGACILGTRNAGWVAGSYQILDSIDIIGAITGEGSFLTHFGQFINNRPFECAHRIKYDTINNRIDVGNKGILADDNDENSAVFIKTQPDATPSATQLHDWNRGIWCNFWALNPVSSNAIPFGPVTVGEIVNLATFDFDNLNLGPDGTLDIFGPKIETRYPIQSYNSWIKLITTAFGSTIDSKGDYSMAIFLVDRNDNIREIDFPLGKTNDALSLQGNLPGSQYKGIPGIPLFFGGKEPDTTDAFDIKEFVFGGIVSKDSYDDQGRYEINGTTFLLKSEVELDIDGWRKAKPLIITNNDISTNLPSRNIETNTQDNESITRYVQGKNLVLGLEKLFTFKRQTFDLMTSARSKVDLRHGDPVYVTNPDMIDETTDGLPHTLKMVVDKITRTFSKAPKGPGGIEEKYSLVTRLFPEDV